MGGWAVVSSVGGENIRERDIGVSIHDPSAQEIGKPGYWLLREKNAHLVSERQRLPVLEVYLLGKHLLAAGDTQKVAMDDRELLDWGRSTGRIVRMKTKL